METEEPAVCVAVASDANRALNSNHDSDFNNQTDLHNRSGILVNFLRAWKPSSRDFMSMIEELWVALYERNFIERQDIVLIRHWLQALVTVGYTFPKVSHCRESTWPPFDVFIAIGATYQDEFRDVFLRSLKLFWPKSQTNLVMVLDEEMENREKFADKLSKWTVDLNRSKIAYNKPSPYYGREGRDRQQLLLFWAENFTNADTVAFVDTDTMFVTVPDSEDLVENGEKPVVIGVYGKPRSRAWGKVRPEPCSLWGNWKCCVACPTSPLSLKLNT